MAVEVTPADPADLFVPSDATEVPLPRYGTRSLAEVVPALITHLASPAGPAAADLLAGLEATRVIVLVVDGLGAVQLGRAPGVAPTLSSLPGTDIDAAFPSTTASSLASLGTGLPPSQHGLVGYAFPLPEHDHPLGCLGWRIGLRGGGFDARELVVPEAMVPAETAFEQAAAAGIDTTVFVHPDFPDSGLTRAVLRGGQRRTAVGLEQTLGLALDAITKGDGPALAYTHHPLVDWAGHVDGACSPAWCEQVADVDRLLARLRPTLPPDVAILVTADHGMVSVAEEDVVELSEHAALLDGVRVLAGEPRVRHLALEADADPTEVAARWRATLGDRALVATRDEALPWFGPAPTERARNHVGDLVVLARTGSLVHERVDPHGGRHTGQHGGPSRAERTVPLRRLTATP